MFWHSGGREWPNYFGPDYDEYRDVDLVVRRSSFFSSFLDLIFLIFFLLSSSSSSSSSSPQYAHYGA
jgi:hypothetical protein